MKKPEFIASAPPFRSHNDWTAVRPANDDRASGHAPGEPALAGAAALSDGFVHALDWLSYGVLILDRNARVLFANTTARRLIQSSRLSLCQGALRSRSAKQNEALRAMLSAGALSPMAQEPEALNVCELGEPPLQCTLARIASPAADDAAAQPAGVLFMADPSWMRAPSATDLHAQLGLTMAEATLAAELAKGNRLLACARRLGIAASTARTHLHRIFDKTGTRRQAELMRLILTSTPALRRADAAEENRRIGSSAIHAVR